MDKIIDNRMTLLGDDLRAELKAGSKVRIAASCFTLFAFDALREELGKIDELKFIFTSPTYTKGDFITDAGKRERREFFIPKRERETSLFGTDFEIRLRNKMSLKAIAKECAKWIEGKVAFKSNTTANHLHSFITIEQTDGTAVGYNPTPQEFSASGLGFEKSTEMLTLIQKTTTNAAAYLKYFDEIWGDSASLEVVTDQVVDSISAAYKENSPEFIYFIILYNIFTEFLDDLNEDNMPNEAVGFKNTKLWEMLYDFQRDGVISIINKLNKHNGCILADSVGLGKTLTALAVILYYSLNNKSVLVLCPKRLGDNWMQYADDNTTNPFSGDRLNYKVYFHTDLGRGGIAHDGRNLGTINWGNFDLVVIDESHNFRNSNPAKDRMTRYDFLMEEIVKRGKKTQILMLSATPVNNRYNDLKNQLALCYGQDPRAFEDSLDTKSSIATIFRMAQATFREWSEKHTAERTSKALIDSLSIDFKVLLDSVTIARSRSNIEKYYDTSRIGKFPERQPPVSVTPELSTLSGIPTYKEIYQSIKKLSLAVYGLFDFVLDSQKPKYERQYGVEIKQGNLTRAGRNTGIKRLMTVNLLKRLESSVEAFRLTMRTVLDLNKDEIRTLDRFGEGTLYPNAAATKKVFTYEQFDQDEDGGLNLVQTDKGKEVKIDYADIDRASWRAAMEKDVAILEELLKSLDRITPDYDSKLQELKSIIDDKIANPLNAGNKKVLIFSAFADTAGYLYNNIATWVKSKYGLETALVEGQSNKTTLRHHPKSTNTILTMFSPRSKNRELAFAFMKRWKEMFDDPNTNARISHKIDRREYDDAFKDIDILIATDCISEGQNLQDCDICVNYDIHWNPVRIVQRYGRIDRIGSINEKVGLVNFWPPLALNEYINLTDRVESRMAIATHSGTADGNPLKPDDQVDDYREAQIKKLREGKNVDLDDPSSGISISDLGLNEFRMDAVDFVKSYSRPTNAPKGMHSVILRDESRGLVPGVIFVLKNYNKEVNIKSQNLLHPYYLVYLDEKGKAINTHLEVKQIMDLLRISSKGQKTPIEKAYKKFNAETDDGLQMQKYNKLLSDAVATIIEVKGQSDVLSLLGGDIDALKSGTFKGLDDFELIAFVVVK